MSPLTYFTFQTKTLFIPFKALYPECYSLIEQQPRVHPLLCLRSNCPANKGCIETIAKRVHYWFEEVEPKAELMIAYFKYTDSKSLRAGIFNKSLDEPRLMTLNVAGFEKFRREGNIRQWIPSSAYINIQGLYKLPAIIPIENLIKHADQKSDQ